MSKASISFSQKEKDIVHYWNEQNIYEESVKKAGETYRFLDGPPFISNHKLHHGHVLTSTLKDVECRYKTMLGYNVPREFGLDTHGLPIETLIMKNLDLKNNDDIMRIGLKKFNDEARRIIDDYKSKWKPVIARIGRQCDFDNGYKTCDTPYMDSIWWSFKELYKKGLIYRGVKVMSYSNQLNTPLSNFEAKLNYKEKEDPSLYFKLNLLESEIKLLIWTTTPWTLPANLAVCVNPNMNYCICLLDTEKVIVGEFFAKKNNLEILETMKGAELLNYKYKLLWDIYSHYTNGFQVYCDEFVGEDSGTGLVHLAPAFGEDDYRVCLKNGIITKSDISYCPLDETGNYTLTEFKGKYCLDCNNWVIKILRQKNQVWKSEKIRHNYPYCWRTDTPLIYRIVNSWFINVEILKDKLIEENNKINWYPEHIKGGRFGQWLNDARDWCISRNRFWGTPIPIWMNIEDETDLLVIGNIKELETLTNCKFDDIHTDYTDTVIIEKEGKKYKRIPEVFDCWYESGSSPFASKGLKEKPAQYDFIVEGVDQCRGWFYTLLVLGVALFGESPYRNVKVSGLLLGTDGSKMSKSKNNFTDINETIEKYTADAVRMYLIESCASYGEAFKFEDKKLLEIVSNVMIPVYNTVKFLNLMKMETPELSPLEEMDDTDRWIISKVNEFYENSNKSLSTKEYHLMVRDIYDFVDKLSRWYVKLNKTKMSGIQNKNKNEVSTKIRTLQKVMKQFAIVIAPVCPFMAEVINLELFGEKSIHLMNYEKMNENQEETEMDKVIEVIERYRVIRGVNKVQQKRPFKFIHLMENFNEQMKEILENELNTLEISYGNNEESYSLEWNEEVECVFNTKNLARETQQFRKELGLLQIDKVEIGYIFDESVLKINNELLEKLVRQKYILGHLETNDTKEIKVSDVNVKVYIKCE